jgi:hypothetical protein
MKIFFSGLILFFASFMPSTDIGFTRQNDTGPLQLEVIPNTVNGLAFFELHLKNTGSEPMSLEFPTSQVYEIVVEKGPGQEIYRYSKGRSFLQAFQTIRLNPGETKKWIEKWDYKKDGISPGEYTVRASLNLYQINGQRVGGRIYAQAALIIPEENQTFRNVKAKGSKGIYTITGEVNSPSGGFSYAVEDGHNEYTHENVQIPPGKWQPFTIQVKIPEDKLPSNAALILYLNENSDNGKPFTVILEKFK